MKRLMVTLFMIVIFFNTCVSNVGAYPRHVDPSIILLENPNPIQLYQLYRRVLNYINSSEYGEAISLLDSAKEITAPSSTQKVLDEYNDLIESLIEELNLTETGINTAYDYLRWLREDRAEEALHGSEPHLISANDSLINLEFSSTSLVKVLGGSTDTLLEGINSVDDTIKRLKIDILEGYTQVEVIKEAKLEGLRSTTIGLAVNNSKPIVGSTISVVGNLLDVKEIGLEGKIVTVFVNGMMIQETLTGRGGFFNCVLNVPFQYEKELFVYAEYWPTNSDLEVFTPSVSNIIQLKVGYETPDLSVDSPITVFPGREFTLNGVLSLNSLPLEGFEINVRYLGSSKIDISDYDGSFSVKLVTPDQASDGFVQISVSSSPQDIVGPSYKVVKAQIVREPLSITLDRPWIVFSGLSALIGGSINSVGYPLKDCVVKVYMHDLVLVTQTDSNGDFRFTNDADLFELSSKNDFTIVAVPKEPWISSVSFSFSYLVINSVMSLLAPFAILTYLYMKRRTHDQPLPIETETIDLPKLKSEPSGLTALYFDALNLMSALTNLSIRRSDTLRDYLRKVRPFIGRLSYTIFERVTKIYEHWLYSGNKDKPPLRTTEKMIKRLRDSFEQDSD